MGSARTHSRIVRTGAETIPANPLNQPQAVKVRNDAAMVAPESIRFINAGLSVERRGGSADPDCRSRRSVGVASCIDVAQDPCLD